MKLCSPPKLCFSDWIVKRVPLLTTSRHTKELLECLSATQPQTKPNLWKNRDLTDSRLYLPYIASMNFIVIWDYILSRTLTGYSAAIPNSQPQNAENIGPL